MASYVVEAYTNEFGVVHKFAELTVYSIVDDQRQATAEAFDLPYLPSNFQLAIQPDIQKGCTIPPTQPRSAQVWITSTQSLVIPCPWVGGTPEFKAFFQELQDNPAVLFVTLRGEVLSSFYTALYLGTIGQ